MSMFFKEEVGGKTFVPSFTPNQQKVVDFLKGNAIVNASAGSGKTTVAIHRIKNLIDSGVPENKILFITFTVNASKEMKKRLSDLIGSDNNVFMGTIHSVSLKMLNKFSDRPYGIIDNFKQNMLFRNFAKEAGIIIDEEFPLSDLLNDYGYCRNCEMDTTKIQEYFSKVYKDEIFEQFLELVSIYEEYKTDNHMVDFDDMTIKFVNLMEENSSVLESIKKMFPYVLIDEAQDCNIVQHHFIDLITQKNTMLIGDIWQSIYAFRGANVDLYIEFYKKHDAKILFLDTNFRSSKEIVDMSNNFTTHAEFIPDFLKKDTVYFKTNAGKMETMTSLDNSEQAHNVVSKIKTLLSSGKEVSDIAVLSRTNFYLLFIQKELLRNKIPFIAKESISSREILLILNFIKLLGKIKSKEFDSIDFTSVKKLMKMQKYTKATLIKDVFELLCQGELDSILGILPSKSTLLIDIFDVIVSSASDYDKILKFIHIVSHQYLPQIYKNSARKDHVIEMILIFKQFLSEYEKETLEVMLSELNYIFNNKSQEGVVLSSVHGAKGLEWDIVFVINCNDTMFPHSKGDYNEEMRIFYVAITRPKTTLYLSSISMVNSVMSVGISPFINYMRTPLTNQGS